MAQPSYRRHRFPASIIQHAIWLYLYADRIDGSIGTPSAKSRGLRSRLDTGRDAAYARTSHSINALRPRRIAEGVLKAIAAAASWALDDQARHVSTHGSASAAKGVRAGECVCAMRDRRRRHFLKRRQAW
jgi:hypothetical protein